MNANPANKAQQSEKENEKKWTKPVMAAGWTAIPSVLLEQQQALGLSAMEINILLHLIRHWWKKDDLPYPSKQTIADCVGVDRRTVQRHIEQMEKRGLIRRAHRFHPSGGQQSNFYDFSGLIKALVPLAKEAIAAKEERRKQRGAQRTRKGVSPTIARIGGS